MSQAGGGISASGRAELAAVLAGGRRIITPDDVSMALGIDATTSAKKLSRWTGLGWLRRARRGLYIPVPVDVTDPQSWSEDPWLLADATWAPCYFTGWTAANHWSLTEQMFRTTVLKTSARVRRTKDRLLDHDYLLRHVAADHLSWGVTPVWRAERRLLVADPARTVIDSLDDPSLIGGVRHAAEVVAAYVADHPTRTLVDYGDRLGNGAVFKRLGYIVERMELDAADLVAACAERLSSGISLLDPSAHRSGARVASWGLQVNVAIGARHAS
jgi:predicted transcriptional regulator of viral defense system